MRVPRVLSLTVLLGWLALGLSASVSGETTAERMKPGHCPCSEGKACWHYLRTPLTPPEDPCRCGLCAAKGNCSAKDRPEGWSATCMGSQKPECFWKRHAASWGIKCLACVEDKDCPACDEVAHLPDPSLKETLAKQAKIEGDSPKKRVLVGLTDHFYVAMDIPRLKVLTQAGGPRIADQHELVHLFLERAEKAYDDFVETFGSEVGLGEPMGIFMAERNTKKDGWQQAYFGNAKTNMLYGGNSDGKVGGGFCFNGFTTSLDDHGSDRDLHAHVRHMIGHLLFSCWHGVSGFTKNCPKWAFVGVADWLCKKDPLFRDWTIFCHDEGSGASGSGRDWDQKARNIAAGKHSPIEKLFGTPSLSHLSYDDHVRSWSYMDLMLSEDRERWLEALKGIREGQEHAVAFQRALGMTPDDFDKRWVERMTGRRKTMGETSRDVVDPEGASASALKRIRAEQDPAILAQLIRGIDRITDVKTAEVVLDRLRVDSDHVRETVVLQLSKVEGAEVIAWMREAGLKDSDPLVRAHIARVLSNLKDAVARQALEALLDDKHWLVRANAALALGQIADPLSVPALVARVADDNPKAWISKVDSLAVFGQAASKATVPVAAGLSDKDWQVRLTACRALAKIGDKDAVDPLIERLDTEGGRLRREIHAALKAVTHETFSENAQVWREWWRKEKVRGLPPPPEVPHNPEDDRYAKPKKPGPDDPTYYGRRIFSQSVLFVIDLSKSMDQFIRVPEEAQQKLGKLPAGPRILVAKSAAVEAIKKLDPRARFNVVFFSTVVRPWKPTLVTADAGTKAAAISAIESQGLEDETNIHGALRAAVGLHEKPTLAADLDPIPDTIYFLTDGTPTRGEITDTETLLSWMRDVNRFAKVDLHVIAMGNVGVDLSFLQRLAEEGGGEFIHVPDQ